MTASTLQGAPRMKRALLLEKPSDRDQVFGEDVSASGSEECH
jgi:hypothetical protein